MKQHRDVEEVENMEKVKVFLYGIGAMGSCIAKSPPGLVTMKDLPIPCAVLKDMRKFNHQ